MTSAPAPAPFDEERLMSTVGGDVDLLEEIVGLFLEDRPAMLERLDEALDAADHDRIWRAAHGIKGSVGNFAATTAASTAAGLERAARKGDLDEARRLGARLALEVERLGVALATYLERG